MQTATAPTTRRLTDAETLDELFAMLNDSTVSGGVHNLPAFGGDQPDTGVLFPFSWDATRALVFIHRWRLVPRSRFVAARGH